MKIAISCESTHDLTKDLLEEFDIHSIPYHVLLGEEEGLDGVLTPEEIFDYVDRTGVLPKTSAVNEFAFTEYFEELLKQYDAVVHISLSSSLSSSFRNASAAAGSMSNVYVIDSKTLSTGIGLLAIYGRQLANEGKTAVEITRAIRNRIPHLQVSFVINTMDYLYKGGRCSSLQRFGANLLRLKPQIIVNNEGKMESHNKYRGKNAEVIEDYCKDTLEEFNKPDLSMVFLTHSRASEDMIEAAKKQLELKGFKKIYITVAGCTISSHCGPKCLGILYFNDGNK